MLALAIVLAIVFLLWAHFVATTHDAMARLGETAALRRHPKRFFYYPLHKRLFQKPRFDLILFACRLSANIARLAFGGIIVFAVFQFEIPYWYTIVITLVLALLVMLLVGDYFPKRLSNRHPERALSYSVGITSLFLWISFPISFFFFKSMSEMTSKFAGQDPIQAMKETIVNILARANVRGKLGPTDQKLIEAVVKFKDRIVREVMVPRVDIFSLPCETTLKEAAHHFLEEGYSRIPVYQESVDNITGVLMFKDILRLYKEGVESKKDPAFFNTSIASITKGVFYTPETKKVSHLLQEFRTKQMHMAIVVDEYGGTEGVVTIEDLLEEIVGEIADEYDFDEDVLYTVAPGGGWIVDARMSILDAEDAFNIHIPQEGEYDTIGGFIFHRVGSIPEKGLKIHHENFTLEILSSSERSIDKIKITARPKE